MICFFVLCLGKREIFALSTVYLIVGMGLEGSAVRLIQDKEPVKEWLRRGCAIESTGVNATDGIIYHNTKAQQRKPLV